MTMAGWAANLSFPQVEFWQRLIRSGLAQKRCGVRKVAGNTSSNAANYLHSRSKEAVLLEHGINLLLAKPRERWSSQTNRRRLVASRLSGLVWAQESGPIGSRDWLGASGMLFCGQMLSISGLRPEGEASWEGCK